MQSRVRFNRVPKKVPEKVPGGSGGKLGQVQQGSGESSGEGLEAPGEGPREGSREGLGAEPVRFRRKFREALAQSRVRFNTVPEKVPEKQPEAASGQVIPKIPGEGLGGFGAKPSQARQTGEGSEEVLVQSQVKFNGFRRRPGRLWCTARSGSTGFQRRFRKRSNLTCCTKASWNLLRSLVRDLLRNPLGNLRNCLRNLVEPDPPLHQSTPELFWAEDLISLRCWGIKN